MSPLKFLVWLKPSASPPVLQLSKLLPPSLASALLLESSPHQLPPAPGDIPDEELTAVLTAVFGHKSFRGRQVRLRGVKLW